MAMGLLYGTVDQFKQDRLLLGLMGSMGSDTAISLVRFRLEPLAENQVNLRLEQRFIGELDLNSYEAFNLYAGSICWDLICACSLTPDAFPALPASTRVDFRPMAFIPLGCDFILLFATCLEQAGLPYRQPAIQAPYEPNNA